MNVGNNDVVSRILNEIETGKRTQFRSRLVGMKNFVEKMENMLASERAVLKEKMDQVDLDIKKMRKNVPDDLRNLEERGELELYFEYYENQGIDLDTTLYFEENIFRKPIVSSLYFFLEAELNNMCDQLHEKKSLAKKLAECTGIKGKGSGIMKAQYYFDEFGGIDFSIIGEWEKLLDLKEIRNCIAHDDGLVKESDTKVREIVKDSFLLSLEADMLGYRVDDDYLRIEKEYLEEYFVVVESFLTRVSKEIYSS